MFKVFQALLLANLADDDRKFAADKVAHPTSPTKRLYDPYGPESREIVRQRVLAGTDIETLIADLTRQYPRVNGLLQEDVVDTSDYWVESWLREQVERAKDARLSYTQPICQQCYAARHGNRGPVSVAQSSLERCCMCGTKTFSGVYTRVDPNAVPHPTHFK